MYYRSLLSIRAKHLCYSYHSFRGLSTTFTKLSSKNDKSLPLLDLNIPEPPAKIIDVADLNALGEPTLSSLGLCSYWPSGWYQSFLEYVHVGLDIPWWAAIASTTVAIRLALFPLIIQQRRTLADYTKGMPHLLELQNDMTKARLSNNLLEMMRISKDIQEFSLKGQFSPLKIMKPMVFQIPIFLSVFAGLREMAYLPIESLKSGGLLWFTDLTVSDPYYILPLLSMTSILIMFETGADFGTQAIDPRMRLFMRAFPVLGFFVVMNMPSALLCYWAFSNVISLAQASILKTQAARKYFHLPEPTSQANIKKVKTNEKGFIEGFRESMTNARILAEIENRERLDASKWQKAGQGSVPKTYSHNPTLQHLKKPQRTVRVVSKSDNKKAIS